MGPREHRADRHGQKQTAAIAQPRRRASSAAPRAGVPITITSSAMPMTAPSWRVLLTTADAVA